MTPQASRGVFGGKSRGLLVESFSRLFFMSTLTWITEKELEKEMKNKGDEFCWKKHEKFIVAVRKWEILAASEVKMSGSAKNESEQKEHKQQNFW